jgi:hypothetical protein
VVPTEDSDCDTRDENDDDVVIKIACIFFHIILIIEYSFYQPMSNGIRCLLKKRMSVIGYRGISNVQLIY